MLCFSVAFQIADIFYPGLLGFKHFDQRVTHLLSGIVTVQPTSSLSCQYRTSLLMLVESKPVKEGGQPYSDTSLYEVSEYSLTWPYESTDQATSIFHSILFVQ